MLKFLHARFRLVVLISLILIIGSAFAAINIFFYINTDTRTQETAQMLFERAKNNSFGYMEGDFPEDYFYVRFSKEGEVEFFFDKSTEHSKQEALTLATTALLKGGTGYIGEHKYIVEANESDVYVFMLDIKRQIDQSLGLLAISAATCGAIFTAAYFVLMALSKRLIAPVLKNVANQNQFIADASHELKTPIAIISAATDVLEMQGGKSEWTQSIKKQTKRMTALTQEMMTLLKTQNVELDKKFEAVPLSDMLSASALDFKAAAKMRGLTIEKDIKKDITVLAKAESIDILLNILLDNAVKYASEKTAIELFLTKDGGKVYLRIRNACDKDGLPKVENIFDKFYRSDKSRSRNTGGSGLGLAIAKTIAEANGAEITAEIKGDNYIILQVTFSMVPRTL